MNLKNPFSTPRQKEVLMRENLLVKHLAGSHAYGTNLPTSDIDYRGVFCADKINICTPFYPIKEVEDSNEEDTKLFELSHFMKLCLDCNPNVIETLWVDTQDIVYAHPAYWILRQYAPDLLSTKIAYTTVGYANSQLKRIKGHNKWINNPQPEQSPQMVDYVSMIQHFPKQPLQLPTMPPDFNLRDLVNGWRLIPFGKDTYGIYRAAGYTPYNKTTGALNDDYTEETRSSLGVPEYIIKFNSQEYDAAKMQHQQYWDWKKNRNIKRSELEEKYGFDTKHAMHLVRLLRMGVEALEQGIIFVKRPDAKELLEIRNGAWTYEQILEYGDMMQAKIDQLLTTTSLRKKPDVQLAANIMLEIQEKVWQQK